MRDDEMARLFCDLVRIPSPSGRENRVADYISDYLRALGLTPRRDDAGRLADSDTGNLIVTLGRGGPRMIFVAHMDTVETGTPPVTPVARGGVISSDGRTVLGADDKAGVAALLAAMKEVRDDADLPAVCAAFLIREESGLMGAKYVKAGKADFVFDVDGSQPPGTFINKALGNTKFDLHIEGREAHAASSPETGLHSIKTAGLILSRLKLGRDREGVLSVGRIAGGTRPNVVPGHTLIEGEVRAFTAKHMAKRLKYVERAAELACRKTGCKYALTTGSVDPPLLNEDPRIISMARRAARNAGLGFRLITLPATTQGNVLAARGYNVLGLCRGGAMPHSRAERIKVEDLHKTRGLIVELMRHAET